MQYWRGKNNRNNEGLSDQMKEFCHRYCTHFDRALAYQEVYDCDSKAARSSANNLMRRDGVSQYIDEILRERKESTIRINVDELIRKLQVIALSQIDDVIDLDTGEIKSDVDSDALASVSEFVCDETENDYGFKRKRKIKQYNAQQAIETLLRISGHTSDLNQSLRNLESFGITVKQDDAGKWFVED